MVGVESCRHLAVTLSGGETAWEDSSVVGGALGAKGCYTIHYETGDDWPVNVRWTMLVRTSDSSGALPCCSILKGESSVQESEIGSNLAHVALQAVTLSALPEETEAAAGPAA